MYNYMFVLPASWYLLHRYATYCMYHEAAEVEGYITSTENKLKRLPPSKPYTPSCDFLVK